MERSTILKPTGCDLTRLPLGALEAFVLSQVDGYLTLEEIAEVCSLELAQAATIADRLVELGAACKRQPQTPQRERRGKRAASGVAIEEDARAVFDPRAEQPSLRPAAPAEKQARRPDPRVEKASLRPEKPSLRPEKPSLRPASAKKPEEGSAAGKGPARPHGSRKSLRMQRASSRRIKAATKNTPPPTARARTQRPPSSAKVQTSPPASTRASKRPAPRTSDAPVEKPPVSARELGTQRTEPSLDRLRKLHVAAREIEIQARVEPLLLAAEQALKTNDVINAANNFRLALQHREDPFIRMKLEEVDRLAKVVRLERSLACARAAENDKRWADAATHLARAHETKPTAEIADRAANALLLGEGDLDRAAALAEQAVSLDPKNVRYRMTLAEVYLAADLLTRAATHAAVALELAPKDSRARDLADAVARAKKEQT